MLPSLSLPRHAGAVERPARLSTRQERDAASALMERLMDAGISYAEARIAVRSHLALGSAARTRLAWPGRER